VQEHVATPRRIGKAAALVGAAFAMVVGAVALGVWVGYVSLLAIAPVWAAAAFALSLYGDRPGERSLARAALWALAGLLLAGIPTLFLAWRAADRRDYEPKVSR
jgi:hypothetical protein